MIPNTCCMLQTGVHLCTSPVMPPVLSATLLPHPRPHPPSVYHTCMLVTISCNSNRNGMIPPHTKHAELIKPRLTNRGFGQCRTTDGFLCSINPHLPTPLGGFVSPPIPDDESFFSHGVSGINAHAGATPLRPTRPTRMVHPPRPGPPFFDPLLG